MKHNNQSYHVYQFIRLVRLQGRGVVKCHIKTVNIAIHFIMLSLYYAQQMLHFSFFLFLTNWRQDPSPAKLWLALLWCTGTEPTVSPRYACSFLGFFNSIYQEKNSHYHLLCGSIVFHLLYFLSYLTNKLHKNEG